MSTFSKSITNIEIQFIDKKYKIYKKTDLKNPYLFAFYKAKNLSISIFKNNKLLLQGDKKAIDLFLKFAITNKKIPIIKPTSTKQIDATIGMDEVGTGDYFGPIITCSCYLKNKNIQQMKLLGVNDSKKLSDISIINIFNKIKKYCLYAVNVTSPKQYNQLINKFHNANIVKAISHNSSLSNLLKQIKNNDYHIILDKFVEPLKYYEYLDIARQKKIKIDIMTTKAETKYLSVACASIIARYTFIKQMLSLSKKINLVLPKGSAKISEIVKIGKLIKKNKNLDNFAKLNFTSITNLINK